MPARDEPDLDPVLADAVRRTYVRPVDEGIASRHVSAIVAAATAAQASAPRVRRGRRVWRPALGMGAAAMLLCLPVGLAAAGVSLPAIVREALRRRGDRPARPDRGDVRSATRPGAELGHVAHPGDHDDDPAPGVRRLGHSASEVLGITGTLRDVER